MINSYSLINKKYAPIKDAKIIKDKTTDIKLVRREKLALSASTSKSILFTIFELSANALDQDVITLSAHVFRAVFSEKMPVD
jgi:hypothetical protein